MKEMNSGFGIGAEWEEGAEAGFAEEEAEPDEDGDDDGGNEHKLELLCVGGDRAAEVGGEEESAEDGSGREDVEERADDFGEADGEDDGFGISHFGHIVDEFRRFHDSHRAGEEEEEDDEAGDDAAGKEKGFGGHGGSFLTGQREFVTDAHGFTRMIGNVRRVW